jgi:hypothetical protein
MALPNTGINTKLVKTAIGTTSRNVGVLVTHENVNEFGIDSPQSMQDIFFWGKSAAERIGSLRGYQLGMFRGYRHEWVAFRFFDLALTSINDYYADMKMKMVLIFASQKLENKPLVEVYHEFSAYFSRTNNFHQSQGTLIGQANFEDKYPGGVELSLNPSNPPDGGAPLAELSKFYINIVHNNSPLKRWFVFGKNAQQAADGGDSYVREMTVPENSYTESVNALLTGLFAKNTNSVMTIFEILLKVNSYTRSGFTAPYIIQVSKTSNFDTPIATGMSTIYVQGNAIGGTPAINGTARFDFTGIGNQNFSVGDDVFYRINFNNAGFTSYGTSKVLSQLPLE